MGDGSVTLKLDASAGSEPTERRKPGCCRVRTQKMGGSSTRRRAVKQRVKEGGDDGPRLPCFGAEPPGSTR